MRIRRYFAPAEIVRQRLLDREELNLESDKIEFDETDLAILETLNVDEVWYWYLWHWYAGHGQVLMRKGSRWRVVDVGHCSCPPGPMVDIDGNITITFNDDEGFDTLEELEASLSDELKVEVMPLINVVVADKRDRRNWSEREADERKS